MDCIPSRPLDKRNYKNKPLDAYSQKDWLMLFMSIFHKTYGKHMFDNDPREGFQTKVNLMGVGLSQAFGEYKWSAKEFVRFLEDQCEESCRNNFEYKVFTFTRGYSDKRFRSQDRFYQQEREEDPFHSMTYHRYYQLRNTKDDLLDVLSYLEDDYVKMMYSFGIPITHKYIQIMHKKTFSEASAMVKRVLKEQVVVPHSRDFELVKDYFSAVFENSVLWGPYKDVETHDKFHVPEEHVFDWRQELEFLWKAFGLHELPIWEESEKNINWEPLPQVQKLFRKGLKRKRKRRK